MSNLIVIRIVPRSPVDPSTFTNYLTALGGLQVTAFDLSFNSPTSGQIVGSAAYVAPNSGTPSPTTPTSGPPPPLVTPQYPAGTTSGIVQQYDLIPATLLENSFFQLESVATAVIEVPSPPRFENLRLVVTWGSGGSAQPIPITIDYYDVLLSGGPAPDPGSWAFLSPSLYLSIPAPPSSANSLSFTLPDDGTPPAFDSLLTAVNLVLGPDPGGTLPDLGKLTLEQCRNLAYEVVWSQQGPVPTPPDPIEDLYTNPPNNGALLSGGTPNQYEADRQQFEAQLQSYYALADATANRLTNYVYALSASISCERLSLAATVAHLEFPANPSQPGNAPTTEAEIIVTGLVAANPPVGFGIPAAYFYALGAALPPQITPAQRYQLVTGDNLQRVLAALTSAINAGTVTDSEAFATLSPTPPSINAAQAARRASALQVLAGSTTALAPLDTISLLTSSDTPSGNALPFNSTAGVKVGMLVSGPNVLTNTVVASITPNSITLSQGISGDLPAGTNLIFTPALTSDFQQLIQSWLAYPPSMPGPPSSEVYQPEDDAIKFWPTAANAHPSGFLNLVLCSLTQGYIIPDPVDASLGDQITSQLLAVLTSPAPPTVATLAAVTVQQWSSFFQQHPSWLPPFTQPGNTVARIAAFVRYVQTFFAVNASGPPGSVNDTTNAPTAAGGTVLSFASTTGILMGMFASGSDIAAGTVVTAVTPTSVTLSQPLSGNLPGGSNLVFTTYLPAISGQLPLLKAPSTDWLAACLGIYGSFTFGSGFNVANLQAAAAQVFPNDVAAQNWLVDALLTIDNLYKVLNSLNPPPPNLPQIEFSLAEALYARGFKAAADITELSSASFQQALTGTVAYDLAATIYNSAALISPPPPAPSQPGPGFQPVNPDGSLTDCIPPECLSPLGPIAYLNEMLQVSESSTCDHPLTPSAPKMLGTIISQRRGPIGNLAASCANLQIPLSLVDLANECLEYLGSQATPVGGTVYDTSADALAGHLLCKEECPDCDSDCHRPATLFAALPEFSTPGTPTAPNSSVEPLVYNKLKIDFSSCCLPYSQALDVSRTYLRHFQTSRFEEMRTFRKCITEFVLDPVNEPVDFQDHLWRYPVRIDTAIEYLGLTPEEYKLLFQGSWPRPCGSPVQTNTPSATAELLAWQLYGFATDDKQNPWTQVIVKLPEFLDRTCLSYCEFLELWHSGFVQFSNGADQKDGRFPDCEPCCLENLWLQFPENSGPEQALYELAVFIRLWRKLKEFCCPSYSFDQLRDICDVLHLFNGTSINADFIRQLAAFQMFRDQFRPELVDPSDLPKEGAVDADRTHLLALWVGENVTKWTWVLNQMIDRIEHYAQRHHQCDRRSPEFLKLLISNLDPLSRLAGFNPTVGTDTWHALPTHTLRFAEVLAKIYASRFSVGEILYIFTADDHLDGDDPFLLPEENEALDLPFELPDGLPQHSVWELRRKLLATEVSDDEIEPWNWNRISTVLQHEFGYSGGDILSLGEHFFSSVLEHAGYQIDPQSTRFSTNLAAADTVPQMWNNPPDGPLQYDPNGQQLWTQLPLTDEAVIEKLIHVRALNSAEQKAVQDLFFQPRALIAVFSLLFADFAVAEKYMIEERSAKERWAYFRRQFVLAHRRCLIIAEHLSEHVAFVAGQEFPEGAKPAMLVLKELFGDENKATADWENDQGTTPAVTWAPPPNGGAFAALLGLIGTGLIAEYTTGALVWRNASGPLSSFGHERNSKNCPVPTVLPSLSVALTPPQMQFVSALNGFAIKDATGACLGGAEGFAVKWSGSLLIDREGNYELWGGGPTPDGDKPEWENNEGRRWRVTLKRGQRTWITVRRHWTGDEDIRSSSLFLKRGVYELIVEFDQPSPTFLNNEEVRSQHTGFQLKYSGPDSDDKLVEIPHHRLFSISKAGSLGTGITTLSQGAADFLTRFYVSSLRDIRRTYQRAFKALLFVHRFALSADRRADGQSELSYLLQQKANFAGVSYYRSGSGFNRHAAGFDFNFLPLLDNYYPPADDSRSHPSLQRIQAMFDWWERIFDYGSVRSQVHRRCERHLWHLFDEAKEKQPASPNFLLRQICADSRHWHLDLHYYQDQNSSVYAVTSSDLEDDRWVVRAWHADQWIRTLVRCFNPKDITKARPDLWASEDPSALVTGEAETGNANLSAFLCDGCFEKGPPRLYEDVKRLNDGLRQRGRHALIAYLCRLNRVPLPWWPGRFATAPRELSDLLLLDVETGLCERASRIEEAITAIQNFVRRARLHLEPGWNITSEFARMWDRQFSGFRVWQACKRRHLYKENYIEWGELERARRVEAFRFLESELCSTTLTVPVPGGLEWWPNERPPGHPGFDTLQKRQPAEIDLLTGPREGLNLLGTPERDAQPSWLAAVQTPSVIIEEKGPAEVAKESTTQPLPFWLEAAIRLGTRFYRVAAAGVPPAAVGFQPHKRLRGEKECVQCCAECGEVHPALVDEYYFWLIDGSYYSPPSVISNFPSTSPDDYQYGFQDDYYDPSQQQSAYWQDTNQLPLLLEWPSSPLVRLAWCRLHNGEFQQPRRSVRGVPVTSLKDADLIFQGRTADSLTFTVSNPAEPSPQPGHLDFSAPGFRYDLGADQAAVLPLVTLPPASGGPYPGGLSAYPYFVYHCPGTHLFPLSAFSPAVAVGSALRSHCRFEAALNWYRLALDPTTSDCAWVHCQKETPPPPPSANGSNPVSITTREVAPPPDGACCDSTDVSCAIARDRAIVLLYLETLRDWGDAIMRRDSLEAFQQARLIFDTAQLILGKPPGKVLLPEGPNPQLVSNFKPSFASLNPRLLDLYEVIRDRLGLIHSCLDSRRLNIGKPSWEPPYFGDNPLREGWRTEEETCCEETDWCHLRSPYRFLFLVQKAQELTANVREFGAQLLAAFEKGDAEYLASLRAGQERESFILELPARKDQWREADWQVEALQKTKAISQTNLKYYNGLIQNGLIDDELAYRDLVITSTVLRGAGNTSEEIAQALSPGPNTFSGVAGIGGSPLDYIQIPIGTPLADAFATAARIMNALAEIASSTAGLELTESGWQRRSDEWVHQTQILTIEIEQIEQQILGAQRRRDQALEDLNCQQRKIEQSAEVLNFLRDKFTAQDLYLYLQKETAAFYYQSYELALRAARQAERAFNFERGHTTRRFIPRETWNTLQEGLTAGERLDVSLRRMEKAYLDENVRERELTKHFSLRLHFPTEYLRLRTTGFCEVDIPEWMFDQDYPGMFMRRIKNVTLTIPCVTGPYTGVHCRLTLLSSMTRIDPRLSPPPHLCCSDKRRLNDYEACLHDPRIVRQYAARDAIATSSGQNDSGMFELNFRDDRYLPFEYLGAVSRWRIELPPENNYFELDTISDLILNLNYTAREGGDNLRRAASETAERHLPGNGWAFFDVRHEFPDAWQLFRESCRHDKSKRRLSLWLGRNLFPYIPGHREICVTSLALLFETATTETRACHIVRVEEREEKEGRESEKTDLACQASLDWPRLYHGILKTRIGPLRHGEHRRQVAFEFPTGAGEILRAFLFFGYSAPRESPCPETRHHAGPATIRPVS